MKATNKLKFGDGPWVNEPDTEQWKDEASGLMCMILRHYSLGHLSGYVGVPLWHPLYGKEYDSIDVDVHGGLTYAAEGDGDYRPAGVWWFRFDCAHLYDLVPSDTGALRDGTYRDWRFVKREVTNLAAQISHMTATP